MQNWIAGLTIAAAFIGGTVAAEDRYAKSRELTTLASATNARFIYLELDARIARLNQLRARFGPTCGRHAAECRWLVKRIAHLRRSLRR